MKNWIKNKYKIKAKSKEYREKIRGNKEKKKEY